MRYLLDTGILLRLPNRADVLYGQVRDAVRRLRADGHSFCTSPQNVSEFWNVSTRPASARGGLGLPIDDTARRLRIIERGVTIIADTPDTYAEWKRLVSDHGVKGVQTHDARLVALMLTHGVTHLLTLNKDDFTRYPGITPVTPTEALHA